MTLECPSGHQGELGSAVAVKAEPFISAVADPSCNDPSDRSIQWVRELRLNQSLAAHLALEATGC